MEDRGEDRAGGANNVRGPTHNQARVVAVGVTPHTNVTSHTKATTKGERGEV